MSPKEDEHYDAIEQWIRKSIHEGSDILFDPELFDIELRNKSEEYNFPYESLVSFFRNCQLAHIKRTAPKVKSMLSNYIFEYERGTSILTLSKKANFSPHLLSRYLVEGMTQLHGKKLSEALRDPFTVLSTSDVIVEEIQDPEDSVARRKDTGGARMAREVVEAQRADPLNGPHSDSERHIVGIEFEVVLEFRLRELGISFETETELRDRGTSRTPDILLVVPLAVYVPKKGGSGMQWKIINWIDSKALFGDVWTHKSSVLPQAESYVHRFGPGLVLYWFGHAPMDSLDDANGDLVIYSWDLPTSFMQPDGNVIHSQRDANCTLELPAHP